MLSLSSHYECYRHPQVTELCSFEIVCDITLIYQQTVCFFTAVFGSGFCLKLQSVAMMVSSRKGLLEDEIERSLLQELTASDQNSCSDNGDSSGTNDLTVVEVIGSDCSDNESEDVQCATASSAPAASSATFMWEDMTNYVGQREQFVDNYGPQNEAQNETHCAKVFKMFFDDVLITMGLKMKPKMKLIVLKCSKCFLMTNELVELIARETDTYPAQKIQTRSFSPLRSKMRDWKPVTKDEMYVVLALFMLMGIIQKPALHSYLKKIIFWPMDRYESVCNFMHFNNNDHIGTYRTRDHLNFSKSIQSCPSQHIVSEFVLTWAEHCNR